MCHTGRPLGRPCKHCSVTALITEAKREGGIQEEGWKHWEEEGVTTGDENKRTEKDMEKRSEGGEGVLSGGNMI